MHEIFARLQAQFCFLFFFLHLLSGGKVQFFAGRYSGFTSSYLDGWFYLLDYLASEGYEIMLDDEMT